MVEIKAIPSMYSYEQYKLREEYDGFGLYKSARRNAWLLANDDIIIVFNTIEDEDELHKLVDNFNKSNHFGIKVIPKEVHGISFNICHDAGVKDI